MPAKLDVSRTTGSGWFLRLRFDARALGPVHALPRGRRQDDASTSTPARCDQPGAEDDDLRSPYLDGDELDLHAWARDALVLELPTQIVCRDDCKGLCAICGENLNLARRRTTRTSRRPTRAGRSSAS